MFASQPLEAAINQADPQALAATRLNALPARRAEQPAADCAAAAAPEKATHSDLEQRAIRTAARLLSLIWEATQLSCEAGREENEREQSLLGEELSQITPELARR